MTTEQQPFRFHHCGVSVPDLETAIAWYCRVLGFTLEQRLEIDVIPAQIAFLRNGPLRFELFEVPGSVPAHPDRSVPNRDLYTHGNKHVAFAVADVRIFVEELRGRGADIVFVREFEHGANAFIRDNSGNLIEILTAPAEDEATAVLR